MTNRRLGLVKAALVLLAVTLGGCGASARDCSLECDRVKNECIQKCNDEQCRTKCTTELDDCRISCDRVTTGPSGGTGGRY